MVDRLQSIYLPLVESHFVQVCDALITVVLADNAIISTSAVQFANRVISTSQTCLQSLLESDLMDFMYESLKIESVILIDAVNALFVQICAHYHDGTLDDKDMEIFLNGCANYGMENMIHSMLVLLSKNAEIELVLNALWCMEAVLSMFRRFETAISNGMLCRVFDNILQCCQEVQRRPHGRERQYSEFISNCMLVERSLIALSSTVMLAPGSDMFTHERQEHLCNILLQCEIAMLDAHRYYMENLQDEEPRMWNTALHTPSQHLLAVITVSKSMFFFAVFSISLSLSFLLNRPQRAFAAYLQIVNHLSIFVLRNSWKYGQVQPHLQFIIAFSTVSTSERMLLPLSSLAIPLTDSLPPWQNVINDNAHLFTERLLLNYFSVMVNLLQAERELEYEQTLAITLCTFYSIAVYVLAIQ